MFEQFNLPVSGVSIAPPTGGNRSQFWKFMCHTQKLNFSFESFYYFNLYFYTFYFIQLKWVQVTAVWGDAPIADIS